MAITPKKKICCECGKEAYIVSKGRCGYCASKTYKGLTPKPMEVKSTFKVSKGFKSHKKHRDSVKELRVGLPEFFQEKVQEALGKCCENCNKPLQGNTTVEVAHILSKSSFPEICTDENNYLLLCGSCHSEFDSALYKDMKIFETAKEKVKLLVPKVGLYKAEIEKFLTFEEYEKITKDHSLH